MTAQATGVEMEQAPPDVIKRAEALVRKHPECFWFRHPEARIRHVADVRLVVERLREYGDRATWREAQGLLACLLPHFKKTYLPS
jgi:hypothetical protein